MTWNIFTTCAKTKTSLSYKMIRPICIYIAIFKKSIFFSQHVKQNKIETQSWIKLKYSFCCSLTFLFLPHWLLCRQVSKKKKLVQRLALKLISSFYTRWKRQIRDLPQTVHLSSALHKAYWVELFDWTKSFLFTLAGLIVHNLRRLSSLGNSNIPIPWPDIVLHLYATQYT